MSEQYSGKNVVLNQATKYGMIMGGIGILGFVGYKAVKGAYKNSTLGKLSQVDDKIFDAGRSGYKSAEKSYQKSKKWLGKKSNQRKLAEGALLVANPVAGVGYQAYKRRSQIKRVSRKTYKRYTPRVVRKQVSVKKTKSRVKKISKRFGF